LTSYIEITNILDTYDKFAKWLSNGSEEKGKMLKICTIF